jgi:apolipoprotein N-acyltransferase
VPDNALLHRFFAGSPRRSRALLFVCGALLILSFAPFGWFVLAPLLLVPLLYGFLHSTPKAAAAIGFWFGAGLFLAGTYWLYISIHVFGEAPLPVAIFLMLGLVVIMGLYYAAAGWLIARLCKGRALWLLPVAPAVWVVIEWLRGWVVSGFPWLSLGYSQIDSPLAGFAPLLGVYGLSLFVLVSAVALLLAASSGGRRRWWLLGVAILPWVGGQVVRNVQWTDPAGPPITATIVQGGIPQDRKWAADQFRPTLSLYRNSLAEHSQSQLIVWPEVAIPSLLDLVDSYVEALQDDLRPARQSLLFGILERDLAEKKVYNSVVLLDGTTRQIYRKRHLVPFGEYFPVPDFVREWMRLMSLPNSDISAGAAVQALLTTAGGHKLAVAICYEDAYGAEQLSALPEASILINVSNDAWFGDSIAPHQHLEIARMRALEVGRPVVRATNTGISAFIAANGSVATRAPQFDTAAITSRVIPRQGLTPYARFGNTPVILLMLGVLGFCAWRERGSREKSIG